MDDNTFHQELARLKHRVSQMASTYHRSPLVSQSLGRDAFHNQLHDLKAQLESMQSSLSSLTATPPLQALASHPLNLPEIFSTPPLSATTLPQSNSHLTLPSGPLFWQLFTALRTDVRSLDSRVADLEQNVSNLEDRVDNLEPTQFTPAASQNTVLSTSQNPNPEPQLVAQAFGEDFSLSPSAPLNYDPWQAFSNDWATQNALNFAVNDAEAHPSIPNFDFDVNSVPSEGVAFRDREIAHLDELMRRANESLKRSETVVLEKDALIKQLSSERDRSDAKIDELENIVSRQQSSLRAWDISYNEKKDYIEYLESESRERDASLRAWASRHYAMQQSFLEKKHQLSHADRQIDQLQRALYDLQSSRNEEIDELMNSKDEEMEKLRDFCEAKDAVTYQQEQIIARGATLLEDRDAELARLGQQMKGLDDDYRNETRERARFARLLDERDDEIGQLKASLSHVQMTKSSAGGKSKLERSDPGHVEHAGEKRSKTSSYPLSPFATAGTMGRRATPSGDQWTPQAIRNYTPLPHEQRRASIWKTGVPTPEQHKFGVPGAFTPSSPAQESVASVDQTRDLRRSDSLKLLQRLALAEEGGSPARSVTKRSRLPLDNDNNDVASRPPLPVRVLPRKIASVNELGSRSQRDGETLHQVPLSRHQSIQGLSRHNRLQAYVEDGTASDVDA